ncbi:capsid protein [Crucivirus-527]|nr:capsid protein [Crucivirus-527]QMW69022.1 capsid protein [Crucivirus-528]
MPYRKKYRRTPRVTFSGYKRRFAGKRKRTYTKPRTYKRRRTSMNTYVKGFGGYSMKGKMMLGTSPPIVKNHSGGFIINHREYIGDVNSSQAFQAMQLPINPGINTMFPWLSTIAQNFEEWVPRGILLEFKTTSSDSVVSTNANAGLGSVVMATEYNVYNGVFGNKQQMENYENATSCKPSCSMLHMVECAKNKSVLGEYFVRTGPVPSTQDQRFYDLGIFQLGVVGMQSNGTAVGELWVTYEIELRKPRILVGVAGQDDGTTNFDHFRILPAGTILPATPFGTITTGLLFPTTQSTLGGAIARGAVAAAVCTASPTTATGNNFNGGVPILDGNGNPTGLLGAAAANTYYLPPGVTKGNFMVVYIAVFGVEGTLTANTGTMNNAVALNLNNNNTTDGEFNLTSAANTSSRVMSVDYFTVSKGNATFRLTFTGTATTPTYADFYVCQLPDPIN